MTVAFRTDGDFCVFAHPPGYDEDLDECDVTLLRPGMPQPSMGAPQSRRRSLGALSEVHYSTIERRQTE